MKSYSEHLKSVNYSGQIKDKVSKAIYKSSCIFPIFESKSIQTKLFFLNYWLIKRNIKQIKRRLTIRYADGNTAFTENITITKSTAFEIRLTDLLSKFNHFGEDFLGSVELEFFSETNLYYPFPAVVVAYFSDNGNSFVHTASRIYNDVHDENENSIIKVKESGFDIYSEDGYSPFFSIINSSTENSNFKLSVEIIDENGRSIEKKINKDTLRPYEIFNVFLKDHFNLKQFLKGKVGTAKISHNLSGVYPRLLCGNFSEDQKYISVTHSYYDNSESTSKGHYLKNEIPSINRDYSIFVPLFLDDNFYTDFKIYPINSPTSYRINLHFYDQYGNLIQTFKNVLNLSENNKEYRSIEFKKIINNHATSTKKYKGVLIENEFIDNSNMPSRIKYGLNVGVKSSRNYPSNICFNSEPSNTFESKKNGTFRWFPVTNPSEHISVITNSSFIKKYSTSATVNLTFHKQNSEDKLSRKITLGPHEQYRLFCDESIINFFENQSGWVTLKSSNPFVRAWYFNINDSGMVGGDHSF